MASSGSFNTSGYGSGNWFRCLNFSWSVQSQSISNNSTTISWTLRGAGGATNNWYQAGNFSVVIDGNTVYSSGSRINLYNGTTVASGTYTLWHDNNGNRSFSASAQAGIYTYAVNCSGSGSWSLPTIPRYATCNQSLANKTETTITMNWSSDSTIDYIWWSRNNGSSWHGIDVADGKSGSYTITGCTENTAYNIKTRVRRRDSQLTTDSSTLGVTTYAYPYANSMPSFTIGERITIGLYNPLKRSVQVYMVAADNSERGGDTTTGTSISGYENANWQNFLYQSIPNSKSGTYKIKVVYGSQTTTKTGGTYKVNAAECSPIIGAVTYLDTKSATTAVTQNNQLIVQGNSTVRYTATGLTAQKSATLSSCKVTVNTNQYNMTISGNSATGGNATIDSSSNVTATVTLTDSRGLTATKNVTVNMLEWSLPTAIISLQRHNNYYSETDINVNADYASLDNKNTISIKTRYKKTTDSSYGSYVTLQDNVTSVLNLNNEYEWDVQVEVKDAFGTTTYNTTLSRGMPIIYFDRIKSSTGFNCFPRGEKTVEVNGVNVLRSVMTRSLSTAMTGLAVNTYTKILFDLSNSVGNGLSATSDGGIKIGAGVSKVLISALLSYDTITSTGSRHIRIIKNTYTSNNTLAWSWQTMVTSQPTNVEILPILADVTENDVLYALYYTGSSDDKIGGNTYGCRTSLTVEVVG